MMFCLDLIILKAFAISGFSISIVSNHSAKYNTVFHEKTGFTHFNKCVIKCNYKYSSNLNVGGCIINDGGINHK